MIGKILTDIFELGIEGMAAVSRRLAFLAAPSPEEGVSAPRQAIKVYLQSLRRLTFIVLFFPIPILVLGIIGGFNWLVAMVGIFWALATLALRLVTAPLGFLVEGLLGGIKSIGERYVKFVLGVLLIELSFTLFVAVFPIKNNIAALPIIIIAAAVLGILEARGASTIFSKKFIAGKASAILAVFTLSLFFPGAFGSLRGVTEKIDDWATRALKGEKTEEIKKALSQEKPSFGEETYTFPEGVDQIEVPLHPTKWSGWVRTPPDVKTWWISPSDSSGAEIKYWNGERSKTYPHYNHKWRRGNQYSIFKLRGNGVALVTIERR